MTVAKENAAMAALDFVESGMTLLSSALARKSQAA